MNKLNLVLAGIIVGVLVACGAGTQSGVGVGGTGTGSQAVAIAPTPVTVTGPITGFGSVIVNGTRFDDSAALVIRDAKTIASNALRLGMTIEVTGTKAANGLTGLAETIRVFSEIHGPVQAVSATSTALTVLGTRIVVDTNAVFSGAASLTDIRVGDIVEAYGLRNLATGDISATRIEVEKAPIPADGTPIVTAVSLTGIIQNLNGANSNFTVNGQSVNYASATISGIITNGLSVRVQGSTSSVSTQIKASTITVTMPIAPNEDRQVEIEGIVSGFVSPANFKLNGSAVNGQNSALNSIQVSRLANGARCQVTGVVKNGIVQASKLECESSGASTTFEVSGVISTYTSISNFVVRNQMIDASNAKFSNGSPSSLIVGKEVSVRGPVVGGILKASTIEIN
jgi:Domain of unknown function (DUF5666)